MNFAIFGAGAWGTAIAIHLSRAGHRVTLVPRRIEQAMELARKRESRDYLPGHTLDNSLQIGLEVRPAIMEADVVLLACPVKGLRQWCRQIAAETDGALALQAVIALCKGLEADTQLLPVDILQAELPAIAAGMLSGPTHAGSVAGGAPTAVSLAIDCDPDIASDIQQALSDDAMRVYLSDDLAGVALGGALKNPYAIGAGICDGLRAGDNAKAAFLTRALAEMVRLGTALGGRPETFYGLSGFGDLVATAFGDWSRNRGFGEAVGSGQSPANLLTERRTVVEGYAATESFWKLCSEKNIDAPILEQLHAILFEDRNAAEAITELMNRPLKAES